MRRAGERSPARRVPASSTSLAVAPAGARPRRPDAQLQIRGTTSGGVVPDREFAIAHPVDSGAGTAFPGTHDKPNARVTQHHPAAKRRAKLIRGNATSLTRPADQSKR